MKTSLGLAVLWSLPFLLVSVLVAWFAPAGNYWKSGESPKAQVEAYDAVRVHSEGTLTPAVYDPCKLDRLVREPQNTISNLAYACAGLAILIAARTPAARMLGLAGIFLGFGSGMYHASLLPEWRMVDILGVYAVLYLLVLVGVMGHWRRSTRVWSAWSWSLVVWLAALYTGIHRNDVRWFGLKIFDSTYVFVVAVTLGCGLALLAYRQASDRSRYLCAAAALVVSASISFAGGIGDRFGGFWAYPEALIQGHAVWHTFGAVAMVAAYETFAAAGFDRSTLALRNAI